MLRFYSRTDDTTTPLLLIPVDWYSQGRTRIIPLRIVNEDVITEAAQDATDVDSVIVLASVSSLATLDVVYFPDTGEQVQILRVTSGDNTIEVARGYNGIFAPIVSGMQAVLYSNPIHDVTLALSALSEDHETAVEIINKQWVSIKKTENVVWNPLGSWVLGDMDPGESVDVDLRIFIPPYNMGPDFCATDRIILNGGETFLRITTDWFDPSNRAIYGTFQFGTRLFADAKRPDRIGDYDKPILQINYYDADEVTFYEAQGLEFPGEDI